MSMRNLGRRLGCGGATAVEFALIAPVLFLLLFGALEASRMVWVQTVMEEGVAAAGRYAMTHPTAGAADLIAAARSNMTGIDAAAITVTAAPDTVGSVTYMTVSAAYDFQCLVAILPVATVHLTSKARLPLL